MFTMSLIDLMHAPWMRLEGIDLNLLVVLDALLAEGSVTRASKQLGLSQSATSHALSRLRALLDDPVLVRTPGGMLPTARARELAGPVRAILEAAERALRPPAPFDPATWRGRFTLGLDDATQAGTLPDLVTALRVHAPGATLRAFSEPPAAITDALSSGRLDLAITVAPSVASSLHSAPLLRYRSVCIVRADHPRLAKRMSLERYVEAGHVVISIPGSADPDVDRILAARGLERRIVVSTSAPLAVPDIVAGSDLVATVPDRLLTVAEGRLRLARHPPPLPLPRVTVSMVWHERLHHDPAQRWLRSTIRSLYRARRSKT
jgi:DNA-binding transcriptional LysR family regulator